MVRVTGKDLEVILPFFKAAAELAKVATCHNGKCGTVIVKNGKIIGQGYNGPAFADEANRTCDAQYDVSIKPKYDKTCCTHAEWRAILDACKRNRDDIDGSILYFMRVDEDGEFTYAGDPYCTTCSRLTLESGISQFALWNNDGADMYDAVEYNQKSYAYFTRP
ncbi:MAG TPA: deaminase [Candidatus Saccharimonadales bacterium]|jgi:deoxycytidylate deaminase